MKGVGPKVRYVPRSAGKTYITFWRDIPGICRDIPESPEEFEKIRTSKKGGLGLRGGGVAVMKVLVLLKSNCSSQWFQKFETMPQHCFP